MKSQRTLFRRFGVFMGYAFLLTVLSWIAYWIVVSIFTIRSIEVIGAGIQVHVDAKKLPRTLLFFPSDNIREDLLADNPILADVQFKKKYPNTLVIIPTIRTPAARLEGRERSVLVDTEGIVLSDADASSPSVPRIVVPIEGLRIGQSVRDPRVTQSLAFVSGIGDILEVTAITAQDSGSLHAVSGELDILFTQDADIDSIIGTLQTALAGFRIKGVLPTLIDLRFEKPVVKF